MKMETEADLREAFAARAGCGTRGGGLTPPVHGLPTTGAAAARPVAVGAGVLASAGTAGAVLSVVLGARRPPTPAGARPRRRSRARHRRRRRRAVRVS